MRSRLSHVLRRLLGVALAACLFVLASPQAHAGSAVTSDGHRVRWDGGLDTIGERVTRQIPIVRAQVEQQLGFPFPGGPADVIVISGLERMRAETGVGVPDWAAGVTVGSRSRIVLRADLLRPEGLVQSTVTTLRHEWVHLAWSRRAGARTRRLPLWAEEGLAELIGGGVTVDGGVRLDFAAAFGRLIPMTEIGRHWPAEAARAALAYRQGRSWVQYFVEKNGWGRLQGILTDLAEGKGESESLAAGSPFEELVFAHTEATLSHWISAWKTYLEETAAPWFQLLLRDFTGTIFLVVAVIGGVAYFFVRRRRRRQMSELPDDPHPAEHLPLA